MSFRLKKKWTVLYSVMYDMGVVKEHKVVVEATNIMEAHREAAADHVSKALKEPGAIQAVIWEIYLQAGQPMFEVRI